MKREDIFRAINHERSRQDAKFPGQWRDFGEAFRMGHLGLPGAAAHTAELECSAILGEESGEVAKAVLERDVPGLEVELIQVAAVCVAWLEARP